MADLTVDPTRVRTLEVIESRLLPMIADEAIERGQAVYRKANGHAGVARANAVGTARVVGIATSAVAAGDAFEAQFFGGVAGFDLTNVNPGSTVFLSTSTGGKLADAAASGTGNVVTAIGTVHVLTDRAQTKYVFVDVSQGGSAPVAL